MEANAEHGWSQRYRLNELAGRLADDLERHANPVFADGTGTHIGALRALAADNNLAADFTGNIGALIAHIRLNYPI